MLSRFLSLNRAISHRVNALFPKRIDGCASFGPLLRSSLSHGMRVIDVGGGRHPVLRPEEKKALGLEVLGLDISAEELASAPAGAYDRAIATDVTRLDGVTEWADVVYSRAVVEHVADPGAM